MSKDLRNVLDNIESSEKKTAVLQSKVDKLTSLVERQKRVVSEQEAIIEDQKAKISKMSDIPEDILELKELIGAQRQQLNEKELELEYAKGEIAQSQKELELVKKQIVPSQKKLEESYETIGNLRAELAEKSSEFMLNKESKKSLENKVQELQAFTDKFKEEQVKIISQVEEKYRKENQDLKNQVNKLDQILLDSKLISTEKDSEAKDAVSRFEQMRNKHEELINRVGELSDQNRKANAENESLNKKIKEIQDFQKENVDKINYFDKLKPLMEKELLFKTFLIVEEVGAITIDDLRAAIGSPIVIVKRNVQDLESVGLLETNEQGKIVVKQLGEN